MKKVLCIAESCCDMIFGLLPRLPKHGEEIYCRHFEMKAGGGANTPIALGRMGVPVRFLSGIGEDFAGRLIKEALMKSGVKIADTGVEKTTATPVSAVLSTYEDRCFASYGGSGGDFMTEERLEEEIRQADIVHTYLGYCRHYPIDRLCVGYGKALSLDVSYGDLAKEEVSLPKACRYLKINEEEAKCLTKKEDPWQAAKALAAQGVEHVIVTLGEAGSIALCGGKSYEQPAVRAGECVDTCGAGDSFAAGVLTGAAMQKTPADMLKLGAILSGICVTMYGGLSGELQPDMVWKRFLEN